MRSDERILHIVYCFSKRSPTKYNYIQFWVNKNICPLHLSVCPLVSVDLPLYASIRQEFHIYKILSHGSVTIEFISQFTSRYTLEGKLQFVNEVSSLVKVGIEVYLTYSKFQIKTGSWFTSAIVNRNHFPGCENLIPLIRTKVAIGRL